MRERALGSRGRRERAEEEGEEWQRRRWPCWGEDQEQGGGGNGA